MQRVDPCARGAESYGLGPNGAMYVHTAVDALVTRENVTNERACLRLGGGSPSVFESDVWSRSMRTCTNPVTL